MYDSHWHERSMQRIRYIIICILPTWYWYAYTVIPAYSHRLETWWCLLVNEDSNWRELFPPFALVPDSDPSLLPQHHWMRGGLPLPILTSKCFGNNGIQSWLLFHSWCWGQWLKKIRIYMDLQFIDLFQLNVVVVQSSCFSVMFSFLGFDAAH